jgi:hypothetical protein
MVISHPGEERTVNGFHPSPSARWFIFRPWGRLGDRTGLERSRRSLFRGWRRHFRFFLAGLSLERWPGRLQRQDLPFLVHVRPRPRQMSCCAACARAGRAAGGCRRRTGSATSGGGSSSRIFSVFTGLVGSGMTRTGAARSPQRSTNDAMSSAAVCGGRGTVSASAVARMAVSATDFNNVSGADPLEPDACDWPMRFSPPPLWPWSNRSGTASPRLSLAFQFRSEGTV